MTTTETQTTEDEMMTRLTRKQVAKQLASYYSGEYERITGKPASVWSYYDDSKRAYCLRGENLPVHPSLAAERPNGWNLLDYVKPTMARTLIVERPQIQTV